MNTPVPGTGRRRRYIAFRGRCDAHAYCSDCKTRRGSNRGNRRVRRAARLASSVLRREVS